MWLPAELGVQLAVVPEHINPAAHLYDPSQPAKVKLRRRQVAKTLSHDGQRHHHGCRGVSQRLIGVANAALKRADGPVQVIVCGASRGPAGDDVKEDRDCVERRMEVGWVSEEPLEEDCVGDVDVAASVDGVDYLLDLGADCGGSAALDGRMGMRITVNDLPH